MTAQTSETDCNTPTGATVPDGQVAAQATFTTGDGYVIVKLTNTLADPKRAGQLLNGLAFTLSEGEMTGTLGNTSADLRRVQGGGSFVDMGPSVTGWALAENVNGGLQLCVLCTDLGAAPTQATCCWALRRRRERTNLRTLR